MASTYTIRPYARHDLSAIATICARGNLTDALANYMRRSQASNFTSYRAGATRYLKSLVITPGAVAFVAEDTASGDVVGWAVWSRHGTSAEAERWQRPNSGVVRWTERKLLQAESKYFEWVPNVDPTRNNRNIRNLQPVLAEEWPSEIFKEYWALDGLYVDPDHYRRGIGKKLALWGIDRGKEEQVPVLVTSSPVGRKLYESVGFEVVTRMTRFDDWIPAFKMGAESEGCWWMCCQPEGTDYLERAKAKMQKGELDQKPVADTPADSIKVT